MILPSILLQAVSAPAGGKIALILGAGCSVEKPTSIPTTQEFSSEVHQRLIDDGIQPLFDTLFSYIDSSRFCLPIFTTNYDLTIESFCRERYNEYELNDGLEDDTLERKPIWNPLEYELFRITRQVRHIVLFKLHGSVDWMRLTQTGKIVKSLPMYDVVDSDEYQNVIIYPTGSKVATLEPYLTGYQYFSKC